MMTNKDKMVRQLGDRVTAMGRECLASLVMSMIETICAHMDDKGVIENIEGCLDDILDDLNNEGLEPRPDLQD